MVRGFISMASKTLVMSNDIRTSWSMLRFVFYEVSLRFLHSMIFWTQQKMTRISFTSWFCKAEDGHCHTLCTILWNFRHSRYRCLCCKHESTNCCWWKVTPVEVGFSYESHDLSGFLWYIPRWLARFLNHQPYQTELCVDEGKIATSQTSQRCSLYVILQGS